MYAFGLMVLMGLAAFGVSVMAYRYLNIAREFWAIVLVGLGIGGAWLANLNLFLAWGVPVRSAAIGVTLTGVAIAGVGYFFREILEFFTGLSRKHTDEAKTIEATERLRRVA